MAEVLTVAGVIARGRFANDILESARKEGITRAELSALHSASWICQACGVRSQPSPNDAFGGMDVHHRDGDPANFDPDNLVCLCPLCHGLMHFDIMLARGLLPGHLVWAPHIDQAFFTLTAHLRAVVEVRVASGALRDETDARDRLALSVRERVARIDRSLHSLRIPEGLFLMDGVDMGLLVEEDQKTFGRMLGAFVREHTLAERASLARRLQGLRYAFDYRFHPKAATYSPTSAFGGETRDWAVIWVGERNLAGLAT